MPKRRDTDFLSAGFLKNPETAAEPQGLRLKTLRLNQAKIADTSWVAGPLTQRQPECRTGDLSVFRWSFVCDRRTGVPIGRAVEPMPTRARRLC